MLEVRNLYKTYRSKTGVSVNAINGVSLKFNKTGLVFVVGKSGCGKSTLLNLLGGLDRPDGGEIIINGTSSLKFSQSDFDSYRNTYVGFVFQEYNLLKDFTVGANIALALELKGEKATEDKINEILDVVDLAGYGNRHINEISGGQKQRVAIARALVKNPEIILADEPSGALDSTSAKLLFDTLKSLSRNKLVIVVSHDRDFAFSYGDRVIEIKDGVVVSDEEKAPVSAEGSDNSLSFGKNEVVVPERYVLTSEDLAKINEYLQKAEGATSIKTAERAAHGKFKPFDNSTVETETETFKPIKSSLPLKCAVKMGASNLGIKKFRLVLTILLSIISFTMFGLYDVMAAFNKREATVNSIVANKISFASYKKYQKIYYDTDNEDYYSVGQKLNKEDISKIEKDTGVKMTGVYGETMSFGNSVRDTKKLDSANEYFNYYRNYFGGFVELKESPEVYNLDFSVAGDESRAPASFDEIAISQFSADVFLKFGFVDAVGNEYEIENYSQLIGKKIMIEKEGLDNYKKIFTLCGVYSTGSNYKKYEKLGEKISEIRNGNFELSEQIAIIIEQNEFNDLMNYSFNSKAVLCDGYYDNMLKIGFSDILATYNLSYYTSGEFDYDAPPVGMFLSSIIIDFSKTDTDSVHFFKEGKTTLDELEVLVSKSDLFDDNTGSIVEIDEKFGYFLYNVGSFNDNNVIVRVVGYYDGDGIVFSEKLWNELTASPYTICFGSFDGTRSKIEKLVDYSFDGEKNDEVYFSLVNHVTNEIELITTLFESIKSIFIWIGIINAIFSALLLSNFIAVGVVNKKTEIGILRAIGARKVDVFKIFFSESGIIAGINFVLSSVLTGIFSFILNNLFASRTGMIVTIMNFGLRQIVLLLFISLFVSVVASFLPIYKLAKKKPVDIILNK